MDFDAQINALESQIENLRAPAETASGNFRNAASIHLSDMAQSMIERKVTSQPELSKQLGTKGLGKLKKDLKELRDSMPRIVETHLNKDSLWRHRGNIKVDHEYSSPPYEIYGNRTPDILNNPLREILGHAGRLLVNAGLEKNGSEWQSGHSADKFVYRYGFDWSPEMLGALKTYGKLYQEIYQTAQRLEEVRRKKAEAEAKNLWDQA